MGKQALFRLTERYIRMQFRFYDSGRSALVGAVIEDNVVPVRDSLDSDFNAINGLDAVTCIESDPGQRCLVAGIASHLVNQIKADGDEALLDLEDRAHAEIRFSIADPLLAGFKGSWGHLSTETTGLSLGNLIGFSNLLSGAEYGNRCRYKH